jgi:phage shock protein PspC (stress-responsive transcriptional regulator)
MNRRLYRSRRDSILGGVAGGVADYFDMDPSIVRVLWAVLALVTGGIFLVLYIVMWIVVPEGPPPTSLASAPATDGSPGSPATDGQPSTTGAVGTSATSWPPTEQQARRGGPRGGVIFGLILIGAGVWFLIDQYIPAIDTDLLWPVALVVLGIVLLVIALRRPASQ